MEIERHIKAGEKKITFYEILMSEVGPKKRVRNAPVMAKIPLELMYRELPVTATQKTRPGGYPGPVPEPRILIMKETCTRKKG